MQQVRAHSRRQPRRELLNDDLQRVGVAFERVGDILRRGVSAALNVVRGRVRNRVHRRNRVARGKPVVGGTPAGRIGRVMASVYSGLMAKPFSQSGRMKSFASAQMGRPAHQK
jgi:hypothetical protein